MPELSTDFIVTFLVLAAEIGLMIYCRIMLKRPVNPLRPRLIPYGAFSLFLALALLVTAAHVVSLVTGHQLMPRIKGTPGAPGANY